MKIAYICDKEHYLKKMSRVRFHSMEAIEKTYDELLAHSSYKELMTFAKVNMRNIIKIL